MGITFTSQSCLDTGFGVVEVVKSFIIACESFGIKNLFNEIEKLGTIKIVPNPAVNSIMQQTEMEIAGVKFKGGKIFLVLTALTTVGGGLWAGFEFYKDYMDMKAIIQTIDTDAIEARNKQLDIKLEQAIDYTRDIKTGLRDDILGIEKQVDRMEDKLRKSEEIQRSIIQNAEERFENKRDALQNDYDKKAGDLRDRTDQKIKDVEDRLNTRLQKALDNPLAK